MKIKIFLYNNKVMFACVGLILLGCQMGADNLLNEGGSQHSGSSSQNKSDSVNPSEEQSTSVSLESRNNPTVTGMVYNYSNPIPTQATTLTLEVTNANAKDDAPSCVIITESQSMAPTDQAGAGVQYDAAVAALKTGTSVSGRYGNECSRTNALYCKCPNFDSTLLNGAGNWDIFYTTNQVIIWVNYDADSLIKSVYTVLNIPAAQ